MVRDREPVGLVAHLLQQVERLGVARDDHRLAPPGQVHLLELLGEARDADVLEPELFEHAHRDVELALAAVDHEQVRRVREALARVRAFVALAQVVAEPAREHFFHRREVVLVVERLHLEAAVVGPLGDAVFHHDHRRDDLGALDVRDVEALDAQRRLGKIERLLQREQGARASVVIGRALQLVPLERLRAR